MAVAKKNNKNAINEAARALGSGNVIICPTDTVYGFLADAQNKKAVDKIFKIKKRPKSKPLPVFVKDLKMAKELAEISKDQEKIIKKKWPGKFTFVLKAKKLVEQSHVIVKSVTGKRGTIALRVPDYKFLNSLLKKINRPLAQTSVNISGSETLYKISDIKKQFENSDVLIIDAGNLRKNKPSKIIDVTGKVLTVIR